MTEAIVRCLGRRQEEEVIQQAVSCFSPWEIKKYPSAKNLPACEYHSCKSRGLQLCFEQLGERSILSAVHFFNEGQEGFSRYPEALPYDLHFDLTNVDVVRKLGEPDGKGGHHVPVWITYDQKGLQVNFEGFSFEDRQNKIASVILFNKQ
uniref:Uncharacterized protein n=1 Tax=Hanusia phi TaxID=3032 RepID=A0A7S0E4S4_9CRYP|mmetsp:Transcript_16809/g.38316  ORF Transcript_16809/g.38316 Transcript_16809/m.38316 type:complete len:150 (+) Transcript_16809:99-548(+)